MIEERSAWRSRFGFYIASVGTAFGLGNLWRFPYVAIDYGGGAFVFLYILLVFFVGAPLMVAEISLGKYLYDKGITLKEIVEKNTGKRFKFLNLLLWLPYAISFAVFCYYSILSGWSLHLIIQSFKELALGSTAGGEGVFLALKKNVFLEILLASVHLLIVFWITAKGLRAGIEKWLSFILPIFIVFLFYVSYSIVQVTETFEAVKFMLYPNFYMLNAKSLSYALGHVLFTMSLGFCTMVTLGSYLPKYSSSGEAGVRIAVIDTLVSIAIGVVLFPVIFVSGYNGPMSEALFRALPVFVQKSSAPAYLALAFYVCIFTAALNVCISLLETLLYRMYDSWGMARKKASRLLFVFTVVMVSLVVYVNSVEKAWIKGSFIEKIDDIAINFFLPVSAILLSFLTLRFVDKNFLQQEFDVEEKIENLKIYKSWRYFLYNVVPLIFFLGLYLRFF